MTPPDQSPTPSGDRPDTPEELEKFDHYVAPHLKTQSPPTPSRAAKLAEEIHFEIVTLGIIERDKVVALLQSALDEERREASALFNRHTEAVGGFMNELHMILCDPLAEGTRQVSEVRAEIVAAARKSVEDLARLTSLGQAQSQKLFDMSVERDRLTSQVRELEDAIDFSQGELREMKDAHETLMRHHEVVSKLCDQNEDALTESRAEVARLTSQLQELEESNRGLSSQWSAATLEVARLTEEVERITKERDRFHDQWRDAEKVCAELRSLSETNGRQLNDAKELLREIRDGEVNPSDEADKFLRDHVPSTLVSLRAENERLRGALEEADSELERLQGITDAEADGPLIEHVRDRIRALLTPPAKPDDSRDSK